MIDGALPCKLNNKKLTESITMKTWVTLSSRLNMIFWSSSFYSWRVYRLAESVVRITVRVILTQRLTHQTGFLIVRAKRSPTSTHWMF
jgi:hypothetical protein